jgi:hypothetical protein
VFSTLNADAGIELKLNLRGKGCIYGIFGKLHQKINRTSCLPTLETIRTVIPQCPMPSLDILNVSSTKCPLKSWKVCFLKLFQKSLNIDTLKELFTLLR